MTSDEHYYLAIQYQLLADYFKYLDPESHIQSYRMHYFHIQKWLQQEQPIEGNSRSTDRFAHIRFLHASPGTHSLEIVLEKESVWRDLRFKNSSVYVETKRMDPKVSIFRTGSNDSPLLAGTIHLKPDTRYTIAISGPSDNLQFIMIEDDPSVPQSEAKMRFWHLSPHGPAIDIAVKKGDVVFSQISFTETTDYLGLTPMTLDLEMRLAGTKDVVLPLNRVSLKSDLAYTLVAVDKSNDKNELETIFLVP